MTVTHPAAVCCNAEMIQLTDNSNGLFLCSAVSKYFTVDVNFCPPFLFCQILIKNLAVCSNNTVFSPSYVHMAVTSPYVAGKLEDVMYP